MPEANTTQVTTFATTVPCIAMLVQLTLVHALNARLVLNTTLLPTLANAHRLSMSQQQEVALIAQRTALLAAIQQAHARPANPVSLLLLPDNARANPTLKLSFPASV